MHVLNSSQLLHCETLKYSSYGISLRTGMCKSLASCEIYGMTRGQSSLSLASLTGLL